MAGNEHLLIACRQGPTPSLGQAMHHLERVLLQAAVLPWLQREVWRLIYDLFCLGCLLLLLVAGRASLVNNKGGVMAVRACALISCALLQAWTSSLLTWHSLTNHVSLSLLELAAVHAASRLSGLQLHLVQAAWQAVLTCCTLRSTRSCSALIPSS